MEYDEALKFENAFFEDWQDAPPDIEQIKALLIRWLKKIPSSQFGQMSRKIEEDWYEQFEETKEYSDRYGKTMFLDEIRCAGSLADIEKVFSYLKLEEDIIAVFLCSKLALSNAHIVRPLIKYTRHAETENGLDLIYSQHPEKGFKHIKHKIAGNIETGIKFKKHKREDLLWLPEGQISWEENGHSTQED